MVELPLRDLQATRSGDLMSRATNDVESIRMAVGPGVLVAVDAVLLFALIVPVMWSLSVKLTLIAFAFFPLLPWITARFGDRIDRLFDSLQAKMSHLSALTQEGFSSVRLIKALVLEGPTLERFLHLSGEYRREGERLARVEAPFGPVLALLTYLGSFGILLFGGREVLSGAITLGTFVAFQRYVVQLSWPMEAIGWAATMNREGVSARRRLLQILDKPPVVSRRLAAAGPSGHAPTLALEHVRFRYGEDSAFELDVADLTLEAGKKIGLVGPVGSGKTTLLNLILRLYELPPGSIYFEGRDVAGIDLERLRRRIANVEQQIFLFSETVAENVALGSGRKLEPGELDRLARVAAFDEELAQLPDRGETRLGERGLNLSGGQKQRLALMRALARRPHLLLLDDALSAVDVDVEDRILDAFFREYPALTLLFATHRLSVMPRLDEVWILKNGRITARGTHERLVREDVWYAGLWERGEGRRAGEPRAPEVSA